MTKVYSHLGAVPDEKVENAETTAKRVNRGGAGRISAHTVPATIAPVLRAEIARSVSAGRSITQTAKEYCTTTAVVTELWLRAELSQMKKGYIGR